MWYIGLGPLGLGPDEAQYWTWSKQLDWGYYSKPPGIAWQIWVGTHLLGDTEMGVRLGALLLGSLLPFGVFGLAITCGLRPQIAFWSGVVMALSPLGLLSSLFAITDGGVVLFWTLACCVVANALRREKTPNYLLLGLCLFAGALFKWQIYYFWLPVVVLMVFYPYFRSSKVWIGVFISLLGLLPSLIWNSQHNWPTFRHVFATVQGGSMQQGHSGGNFWEFLGAQFALLSPLLFGLLLLSFAQLRKRGLSTPLRFCGWMSLGIFGLFLCLSLFKKMQGNWCDFMYPTAIVFLCYCAMEEIPYGLRWLQGGLIISILLSTFIFAIPMVASFPYKWNPFRQNMGVREIAPILQQAGYDPTQHFLFGDKYQMSSLLSFYGPGQKRAYFLNLHGIRNNQFSYWPGMAEEQRGATGFFVLVENKIDMTPLIETYRTHLEEYFARVEVVGVKPLLFSDGKPVKNALIFKGIGYNGHLPPSTELY